MSQNFDVPVDVPWSLVAASPDMMDTTFCDGGFPPAWRSSLAISAYEPPPGDLPQQLCNQRITYLKVTCSITGYQPSREEVDALNALTPITTGSPGSADNVDVALPDTPADVVEDLVSDYYACYGVLLNVAVFPSVTTMPAATATSQQYAFSGSPRTLSNPFSDAGLMFSLPQGDSLSLVQRPPNATLALLAGTFKPLQIDLPASTNIVLKMLIQNGNAKGTVTAYQRDTAVYSGALPGFHESLQDVPVPTSSPVTRIVIEMSAEECFLAGLSYDAEERKVTLGDYPHIIDFEPTTRDLYQAATDQGEILTASNSSVNTGKSSASTSSSEMGLGLNASVGATIAEGVDVKVGGDLTSKWGSTQTDGSTTQIDQSRERRETQGTTTDIIQQYNLLTGYHAGTNRAAFLMLPRPHTLQTTDYRTFVRGLRMIEGVQEFFLIVSRPAAMPGICVESSLETGHFPENAVLSPPPAPKALQRSLPFTFSVGGPGGDDSHSDGITYTKTQQCTLDPGWTLDTSPGTGTWQPGVDYGFAPVPGDTVTSAEFLQATKNPNYPLAVVLAASDQNSVSITGSCKSGGPHGIGGTGTSAWVQLNFTVYETQPGVPADAEPQVVSPFLVTSRDLAVCINSCPDGCVTVVPTQQVPYGGGTPAMQTMPAQQAPAAQGSIVYEANLKLPGHLLQAAQLQKSRTPAARELMHQVRGHMLSSWRLPQRRPQGSVGFADSDYVAQRLASRLPPAYLSRPIGEVQGLPDSLVQGLGATAKVGDVLKLPLHLLRARANVGLEEAIRIRRRLLGMTDGPANAAE